MTAVYPVIGRAPVSRHPERCAAQQTALSGTHSATFAVTEWVPALLSLRSIGQDDGCTRRTIRFSLQPAPIKKRRLAGAFFTLRIQLSGRLSEAGHRQEFHCLAGEAVGIRHLVFGLETSGVDLARRGANKIIGE